MKRLFRIAPSAFLLFVILSLCGCFGLPNHRIIDKGNIHAIGGRIFVEPIRYRYIEIGTPDNPWDGRNHFIIEFPSNMVVRSSEFSLEHISSINPDLLNEYSAEEEGWPKGSKRLHLNGCSFIFSPTNELLSFRAQIRKGKSKFKLGKNIGSDTYKLPLTEKQMHILFGTNFTVSVCDFRL